MNNLIISKYSERDSNIWYFDRAKESDRKSFGLYRRPKSKEGKSMKKIISIAFLVAVNGLIFGQERPQASCNGCPDAEEQAIWVDPNFEDNYEDSDVDSEEPEPQVSWPGKNRDPFYDQVVR